MDNGQKHKSKLYGSKTKFTVSANHAFYESWKPVPCEQLAMLKKSLETPVFK